LLDGCLGSLRWADELLVLVDAASRDGTAEVARRHTERVVVLPFAGFPRQRNRALDLLTTGWALFVDADERVPPSLAAEVRRAVAEAAGAVGFWIPRRNVICGRWIRGAGWWPDRQLRLLKRGRAAYDESDRVHEVARLDGTASAVGEPLLHLNYETLAEFRAKQACYAGLEARALWERGARARPRNLVLQPIREFRRRFLELAGYRQGWLGLQLSLLMAEATFATYRELLRLGRTERRSQRPKRWMPVSEAK
jgi:glycosyltransferase involved in cell wall biosynthesis